MAKHDEEVLQEIMKQLKRIADALEGGGAVTPMSGGGGSGDPDKPK